MTEDLLQKIDLTLARAISKCQTQKAAKKQCAGLHNYSTESCSGSAHFINHRTGNVVPQYPHFQDAVPHPTQLAELNAQPTARPALTAKKLATSQKSVVARRLDNGVGFAVWSMTSSYTTVMNTNTLLMSGNSYNAVLTNA